MGIIPPKTLPHVKDIISYFFHKRSSHKESKQLKFSHNPKND